jgi:homoserine dehydrogenase
VPPWGVPQRALRDLPVAPLAALESEYYLRFMATDRPGVLARIAGVLGRFDISIAAVIQRDRRAGTTVPIVIRTHRARERDLARALKAIDALKTVRGTPSPSASRSSSGDDVAAWGGLIAQYRSRMPVKAGDRS